MACNERGRSHCQHSDCRPSCGGHRTVEGRDAQTSRSAQTVSAITSSHRVAVWQCGTEAGRSSGATTVCVDCAVCTCMLPCMCDAYTHAGVDGCMDGRAVRGPARECDALCAACWAVHGIGMAATTECPLLFDSLTSAAAATIGTHNPTHVRSTQPVRLANARCPLPSAHRTLRSVCLSCSAWASRYQPHSVTALTLARSHINPPPGAPRALMSAVRRKR